MADPFTIIGTAASVASIVEILVKTVSTLSELHGRWKLADFTFINLIAQLTALKAALNKLQEWMDADMEDPHHQLVMDLELSIACCRMLVSKLDFEVSQFGQSDDHGLDKQSKMKLIVKNGTLEELQKMVERQTNALTLLLTVCNCKAISDQSKVLQKSSTRRTLRRVRDDTSSLYVQDDSASLHSRWTGRLSNFSKMFDFDRELFVSKVYEKVIRTSLKPPTSSKMNETLPMQFRQEPPTESSFAQKKRSQFIDRQLEEQSRILSREVKILMLGDRDHTQTFGKQLKIIHMGGFTTEELQGYKSIVRSNLQDIMEAIVFAIEESNLEMDVITNGHAQNLSQELEKMWNGDPNISLTAIEAVKSLWANEQLMRIWDSTDVYIPVSASYFIQEAKRIFQEDFIPTESDILRAQTRTTGVEEYKFKMGELLIHIFDIGGQRSERSKWIHQFENVTSIFFSVDISCYDNKVMEQLRHFDFVVNSRWFMHTSIILLFCNAEECKRKLTQRPMCNYFPDYTGGDDINKAAKYLLWRFNQLNRSHLNLYPHLCETSDFSSVRLVFSAIKETILQNALKSSSTPDRTTLLLREKEAIRKDAGYGKEEVTEEIGNGNDEKGKDVEEQLNAGRNAENDVAGDPAMRARPPS